MNLRIFIKSFWQKWLKVGRIVAYWNTKLLLGFAFYTIFTLYGKFVKLLRKDLLSLNINSNIDTYWMEKETNETEYNKQY